MTVSHILVATDGSEDATNAVRWTAELAHQIGAQVTAVHVFEPLFHLGGEGPLDLSDLRAEARRALEESWCGALQDAGVELETMLIEGKPADAIADTASRRGADLIVVGARGLSTLGKWMLGSTSQRLPHVTTIPVVVIRNG